MNKKMMYAIILIILCGITSGVTYYFARKDNQERMENSNSLDLKKNNTANESVNAETAQKIVTDTMEWYYQNLYEGKIYCGQEDDADVITNSNGNSYYASKEFKTKESIISYLNSYMSKKYINEYMSNVSLGNEAYIESDGKLYCLKLGKGTLNYKSGTFEVKEYSNDTIKGEAIIKSEFAVDVYEIHADFTLVKENSKWVLDTYNETSTNQQESQIPTDDIVSDVIGNYYATYFHLHKGVYCGNTDKNDSLPPDDINLPGEYMASTNYHSLEEIRSELEKTFSNKFINYLMSKEYIKDLGIDGVDPYKTQNGKLYCYAVPVGTLSIKSNDYKIISSDNNRIVAEANVVGTFATDDVSIHATITLIKQNNSWVIDQYQEN